MVENPFLIDRLRLIPPRGIGSVDTGLTMAGGFEDLHAGRVHLDRGVEDGHVLVRQELSSMRLVVEVEAAIRCANDRPHRITPRGSPRPSSADF